MESQLITGIAADKNEAKVILTRVPDRPGAVATIFGPLAAANINVDMIIQNVGRDKGETDVTFTVPSADLLRAQGRRSEALAAFAESVRLDLARSEQDRAKGPAITNLLHMEALAPGAAGQDPLPTALRALSQRPDAVMLRRLTLDVVLDRAAAVGRR